MAISNFKIRTIITVIGIPALGLMTLFTTLTFAVFFTLVGLLILHEIYRTIGMQEVTANQWLSYLVYLVLVILQYHGLDSLTSTVIVLGAMTAMSWEMFRKKRRVFENSATTLFAAAFIGLSMGFLLQLQQLQVPVATIWDAGFGSWAVLAIFAGVWVCDILAYLIGSAWGRHKIFPRVSPKKSWEGSLAGLLGAIGIQILFCCMTWLPGLSLVDAVILGLITGGLGQVGDFAESLIKRDVAIKDSSDLIPGHGGVWDRMDSLLFAVPAGYLYILYFVI